jgi:predicted acyltransferase
MTVALMILVNTPGSWNDVYPPLRHAQWHGCTLTDLVFPFFLFTAGVSMAFSFAAFADRPRWVFLRKTARRILLIFALGLFLNAFPPWLTDFSHLRILGVLQRIALSWGLAAFLVVSIPPRWLPGIVAAILLSHWGILRGVGGPDPYSLSGNAAGVFDRILLGSTHLYQGFGVPFDPEGLYTSIPAAGTVLIGYLVGRIVKEAQTGRVVVTLSGCGAAATAAGYLWGMVLPLNKPLWTSSYVLYTAGLASLLLALLIYVIERMPSRKWTPIFSVFGTNALFLFTLSVLWGKTLRLLIHIPDENGRSVNASVWLYQHVFVPLAGPMNGSLLFAVAHVAFFWLIGYILYRRGIFIKV